MSIADAAERATALDVTRSFCVSAPAGSGKTELLIQRYLALLGRVQRPEQVLAITFTRKAAAEMRERVLQALAAAEQSQATAGEHEQITRQLAEQALATSAAHNWQLTRDVSRLNIKTIDSFCAGLTRQMPVLSRFGGQAQAVDNALPLYREAVQELFAMAGSSRPEMADLDALLLHFDNNWEQLAQLLVAMLGKRDQWHEYMGARTSPQQAEARLQQTVSAVILETLTDLSERLGAWHDELLDLLCYARGHLGEPVPDDFPSATEADLHGWRALGDMLLTQGGTFRKSVNVRNGFPTGDDEAKARKAHFADLVKRMAAIPDLQEELAAIAWLPSMDSNAHSWQMVIHLSHVLPLLAACLLLVFERRGVVDHSQVALSALDALGEDDAPTELALRLDYSIEHILVDEFQDTAINQYRLVERLTRGWGEHNGQNPSAPRTIFIVGDGMQSIYGFRNANVGLFLKAREQGFNGVMPVALALRSNFRSESGVVDWVNESFRMAFPVQDNVRRGRVSFTAAVAVKPAAADPAVNLHGFWGEGAREQEAQWMAETLQRGLADPTLRSIAVLGRSRGQLAPLMQILRSRGIPFAAQDMDSLASSPAIGDLLTLCRALANPADRVAWLAMLRAPWCGLELADLHAITVASEHPGCQSIQALLLDDSLPAGLSAAGAVNLKRVAQCLRWARSKRDRLALRVWLEQLWQYLGGPDSLVDARYLQDAERFLQLLQEAELEGAGLDIDWLQERVDRLYAAGETPDAKLQVMTLHKAKGLEFDWVLIPALGRSTRGDSRDILLWDEYNSPSGQRGFLLAADDHSDDKTPGLYNFLKRQRREKSRLETTRLLYVGATRAVRKLTLSACVATGEDTGTEVPQLKPPGEGSLLAPIWPVFEQQMQLHPRSEPVPAASSTGRPLLRLEQPPTPPQVAVAPADAGANIPQPALNWLDRHVGNVIHEVLEDLSRDAELPDGVSAQLESAVRRSLQNRGIFGVQLDSAQQRVVASLQSTLADENGGRWLLSARHRESHSELPLTINDQGKPRDIIVDRTFIDAETGHRWIVDYKSSVPAADMPLAQFLAEEAARYGPQLRLYRDSLAARGEEPLRCALYFTALAALHHLVELDLG
ncbi:UvrD-helicase domain-containing protein [Pseudohalioglobus lutimaris]|uniref:DNA 3'-5' helicase n=1 Tax=Pseudohalioglobus lutimaris TaxID=1737061 RepID=A0A2N5X333_9GAMM|nr:UvrD-helicase domain-containing protein [Pseudohalioglobus lutimaris]PLW68889.1 DNA helicase UvrD [Pseudohalioglobus lutimaris]